MKACPSSEPWGFRPFSSIRLSEHSQLDTPSGRISDCSEKPKRKSRYRYPSPTRSTSGVLTAGEPCPLLTLLSVPQWVPTTVKHQALQERASERTGREKALETEIIQWDGGVKRKKLQRGERRHWIHETSIAIKNEYQRTRKKICELNIRITN